MAPFAFQTSNVTTSSPPSERPERAVSPARTLDHLLNVSDLPKLRRVAVKVAGGMTDPDDLLQDALERALRNVERFGAAANRQAWLRTTMQRLVIDEWRRTGRRQEVAPDELVTPEPEAPEAEPAWRRYSLEEVRQAMATLREPLRTTFELHLTQGLCYAAIARQQGVPLASIGARLHRARRQVRDILQASRASTAGVANCL